MRLALIAASLFALAPVAAHADVAAHYRIDEKVVTVEIDDGGDSRIALPGQFALIHHAGADYLAVTMGHETRITELAPLIALVKGQMPLQAFPPGAKNFTVSAAGSREIAGVAGTLWSFTSNDLQAKGRAIDFTISADPRLAPLGAEFRRYVAIALEIFGPALGNDTNFVAVLTELLAKGAPIEIAPTDTKSGVMGKMTLVSLSTDAIPASHFELPGTPVDPIAFLTALAPSENTAELPKLP